MAVRLIPTGSERKLKKKRTYEILEEFAGIDGRWAIAHRGSAAACWFDVLGRQLVQHWQLLRGARLRGRKEEAF
jgi:hypothetical protein